MLANKLANNGLFVTIPRPSKADQLQESKLVARALEGRRRFNLAVTLEVYTPSSKGRGRGYYRLRGSRLVVECHSADDVSRIKRAIQDALEGL